MVFRLLVIITEALLGLIATRTVGLMCNSWARGSQPRKDPASTTDFVNMLVPSPNPGTIHLLPKKFSGLSAPEILRESKSQRKAIDDSGNDGTH